MAYISKENTIAGIKPIGSNLYGVCTTASDVSAKVVTMPDFDVLVEGVTVHIFFQNENAAATPTLKVGSTTAKSIYRNGVQTGGWEAGALISFTYYQGVWRQGDADDVDTITNSDIEYIISQ